MTCHPNILTIPVKDLDEVSFERKFKLVATINHSGNLNNGHYWAYIEDQASSSWLHCNDRAVTQCNSNVLNNDSSYLLLYHAV